MHIEVDQSVRIEDAQDTVFAFSNGKQRAIVIPVAVKRRAEQYLRSHYRKARNPELRIFTAALFLLLKDNLNDDLHITIDKEWQGSAREASIKGMLLNYIRQTLPDFPKEQITFRSIGKRSRAHKLAYAVHRGKDKKRYAVREEELLALLKIKQDRGIPAGYGTSASSDHGISLP